MAASAESMAERLQRESIVARSQPGSMAQRLAGSGDPGAALFGQSEFERESSLPFMARMKFNAADNDRERRNAFEDSFPEGDLQRVPFTGEWVYKLNSQDMTEPWKTVERSVPLELTLDSITKESLEFGKDVADFSVNTVGPVGGEIALAIATRGRSLLTRMIALVGGGGGGELAQEAIERTVFEGEESLGSVGTRVALAGGSAPLSYGIGVGIGRTIQGVTGRGFISASPEAREAMAVIDQLNRQLEELGSDVRIPQLSTGQAAEAPIFRRIEEQSAALTSPVRRQRQAQVDQIQKLLDEAVDADAITAGRQAIESAYDAERNRLLDRVLDPRVVLSQGGRALEEGVQRFDRAAQLQIDSLYELARKIEEPTFNLGRAVNEGADAPAEGLLQAALQEIRGIPVAARRLDDEALDALAGEMGIDPRLLRPSQSGIRAGAPDPEIESIAAEMLSADPDAVTTEVLRAWRGRLFDLAQSPTGQLPGQTQFQARRLFTAVNRTLDSPTNHSPRFLQAWKNANSRAAQRFEVLEKAQISRILKSGDLTSTETVEQLADSLQSPLNVSNLKFLKSVVPNDTYEQFTNSFKTRLLQNPDEIGRTLDSFDKETLQFLLSPSETAAFRTLSESLEVLNSVGVREQLTKQTVSRQFLAGLIERNDTAGIQALRNLVNQAGGRNSPAGQAIRHTLLDVAFDKFVVEGEIKQLSTTTINNFLKDLSHMGFNHFLTEGDRQLIRQMKSLAPFFRFSRGGAGASIQAAEAASGVVEGSSSAIWELIEKAGAGRLLIQPRVRSFLLGRPGSQPIDATFIKLLAAAGVTATAINLQSAGGLDLIAAAAGEQ